MTVGLFGQHLAGKRDYFNYPCPRYSWGVIAGERGRDGG